MYIKNLFNKNESNNIYPSVHMSPAVVKMWAQTIVATKTGPWFLVQPRLTNVCFRLLDHLLCNLRNGFRRRQSYNGHWLNHMPRASREGYCCLQKSSLTTYLNDTSLKYYRSQNMGAADSFQCMVLCLSRQCMTYTWMKCGLGQKSLAFFTFCNTLKFHERHLCEIRKQCTLYIFDATWR